MKSPRSDNFTGEFSHSFQELMLILLKVSQKIEDKKTSSTSFYEANITLILKSDRHYKKKIKHKT